MPPKSWKTYGFRRAIAWKSFLETEPDNIAFVLMTNGVFVLSGETVTPLMWKSLVTISRELYG